MIEKGKGYESGDLVLIEDINSVACPSGRQNILIVDLQRQIMQIVTVQEMKDFISMPLLASLTEDIEVLMEAIQKDLHLKTAQQILQVRLHQLALAKILVFTHGKSDFRLVAAHFAIGKAYLECKCFEQAVNHLTIASTKVSKMGDVRQTKVYNSYILTALARCYLALEGHHHALELLSRAYDIQSNNQTVKASPLAQQTLQLLANIHLKLKTPKQAIRVLDKLIDILHTQFVEYDSLLCRLTEIVEKQNKRADEKRPNGYRKKADYNELQKILQSFKEKLQFLIVEYDRRPLRQNLGQVLKRLENEDPGFNFGSLLSDFQTHLHAITQKLIQELKRQRIFKFKVYWQGEGEHLNNSINQELKNFIKQYDEEEPDHPLKKLTKNERLQAYKLSVQYCVRFQDHERQLDYLKRLQDILLECMAEGSAPDYKLELLKVKRNMAMIESQARLGDALLTRLKEIKELERDIFGKSSPAVKKTTSMMRIIQEELAASNLKQTTEGEGKDKRNSTKSKKCTVLRFESQSRQPTRILRQ